MGKYSEVHVIIIPETGCVSHLYFVDLVCSFFQGASVYSASVSARREFPDIETEARGGITIARRVLGEPPLRLRSCVATPSRHRDKDKRTQGDGKKREQGVRIP